MGHEPSFGVTFERVGDYIRYPRRVMLDMLRHALASEHLFTNTEGHLMENPYQFKTDENGGTARDSKIELADAWTQELEAEDPRPIVVIQRGPLGFHDSSVDGFKGSDARGLAIEYADFLRMPLTFLCFSQVDLESEEIGIMVGFLLRFFRHTILKNTMFHKVDSPVVGEMAVIERGSRSNLFSTPVSYSVYMPINWVVKTSRPKQAAGFAVQSSFSSMK